MEPPLQIALYSKTFAILGWIGDPESIVVNLRHNDLPTAMFTIPSNHVRAQQVIAEGTRAVIHYRGRQVLSGTVSTDGNIDPDGVVTAQVRGDWAFFTDTLGWQVPTSGIDDQTAAQYDARTGPAETVLKQYAQAAITRAGLPIAVKPDLGRGGTISAQLRMNALADQLFPAVDLAGLGTTIYQEGAGLILDVYEPAWFPLTLTAGSGIVEQAAWIRNPPTVTRAVAGGQGEGVARVFRSYVDVDAEALWGIVRESFVDATDAALPDDVTAAAQAAVTAGAGTVGLSLSLAETDSFRYGDLLRVGDIVTTQIVPGADPTTEVLRQAVLTWDSDNGLTVTPSVGDHQDDPTSTIVRAVSSLARAVARRAART